MVVFESGVFPSASFEAKLCFECKTTRDEDRSHRRHYAYPVDFLLFIISGRDAVMCFEASCKVIGIGITALCGDLAYALISLLELLKCLLQAVNFKIGHRCNARRTLEFSAKMLGTVAEFFA